MNEPHGRWRLPHHLVQAVGHTKGQPGLDEVPAQLRTHIRIAFRAHRRQLRQVDRLHTPHTYIHIYKHIFKNRHTYHTYIVTVCQFVQDFYLRYS